MSGEGLKDGGELCEQVKGIQRGQNALGTNLFPLHTSKITILILLRALLQGREQPS
jgi:hypothetical protein